MIFRSLRWRIATFYAILLLGVIAVVGVVLALELRAILFDEARSKVDSVASDIGSLFASGGGALGALGDGPQETALALTSIGALEHFAGPTTYVEIDNLAGYPENKSANFGGLSLGPPPFSGTLQPRYRLETLPRIGTLLVRSDPQPAAGVVVQVGESLELYDEALGRVRGLIVLVVALAAVVVVAGSYLIAAGATAPINRLIAAMREIRSDRLTRRLHWPSRADELGTLAQSFDAMLDRLEDGFARERQFISDASHELKTPLTVINANAQMLERWADRDPKIRGDSLRAIREESAALAGMVNGMLLLAKAETDERLPRAPLALDGVVAGAVHAARPRAEAKGLDLAVAQATPPGEPVVLGDGGLLRQLVANLIDNAIKFTERGRIEVALGREGADALLRVSDTGVGIDEAALERVFDRFFRTDASRNRAVPGTGLGLAIVRSIARVHGGSVSAARNPEGGASFLVRLPTFTGPS